MKVKSRYVGMEITDLYPAEIVHVCSACLRMTCNHQLKTEAMSFEAHRMWYGTMSDGQLGLMYEYELILTIEDKDAITT